jgi:hypothetical protein
MASSQILPIFWSANGQRLLAERPPGSNFSTISFNCTAFSDAGGECGADVRAGWLTGSGIAARIAAELNDPERYFFTGPGSG